LLCDLILCFGDATSASDRLDLSHHYIDHAMIFLHGTIDQDKRTLQRRSTLGNNAAAIRASQMLDHFPHLESVIMVGIAGGIPNPTKPDEHVRLGDVVVSGQGSVVETIFQQATIRTAARRRGRIAYSSLRPLC